MFVIFPHGVWQCQVCQTLWQKVGILTLVIKSYIWIQNPLCLHTNISDKLPPQQIQPISALRSTVQYLLTLTNTFVSALVEARAALVPSSVVSLHCLPVGCLICYPEENQKQDETITRYWISDRICLYFSNIKMLHYNSTFFSTILQVHLTDSSAI